MKLVNGYLGQDLQLEGSISSKDSIRIDGNYVGSIISKHMVIVGSSGKVKGEIDAPVIQVDGWVEGDLKATKLVEIMGEAKINLWILPIMLLAGFLTPWPYNYWRLKKFNISCH